VAGYEVEPVGWVRSPLTSLDDAPRQGDEGGTEATIEIRPEAAGAVRGLQAGDRVLLLTWLDRADRSVLQVHPRSDPTRPVQGVFSTRSPDRPNPIGLHQVEVLVIEGSNLRVAPLEVVDGTPVLDIKPVLDPIADR
jgi:tRNA-Thr(GGU) m(6)t(6)A37 methyltransferase TsaA